jgi:hypothetical protein
METPDTRGDTLPRHLVIVHGNASDNRDDELNEWYDGEHLPDVLAVPGFIRATRYAAQPSVHGELPEHKYLAIYEIEADSLQGALKALSGAARGMHISDALGPDMKVFAYTQISKAQESTAR